MSALNILSYSNYCSYSVVSCSTITRLHCSFLSYLYVLTEFVLGVRHTSKDTFLHGCFHLWYYPWTPTGSHFENIVSTHLWKGRCINISMLASWIGIFYSNSVLEHNTERNEDHCLTWLVFSTTLTYQICWQVSQSRQGFVPPTQFSCVFGFFYFV